MGPPQAIRQWVPPLMLPRWHLTLATACPVPARMCSAEVAVRELVDPARAADVESMAGGAPHSLTRSTKGSVWPYRIPVEYAPMCSTASP